MTASSTCTRALAAGLILGLAAAAAAQPPETSPRPAFSLASSQVFTTRERPAFMLTFRRVAHLDFRVYRVRDPLAFFARLRDPHVLGSQEPIVPQERTWLERIADWKAGARDRVRAFVRRQFSPSYRRQRRERLESQQVQLRRTAAARSFAQVPLLNSTQVVASWREFLPPVAEAEARRIPLDVKDPGVYVVEAVSAPLRAYTIVIVSDVGLVSKASPGQIVVFAANRFTGEPAAGCHVQTVADREVVAVGVTADDGTCESRLDHRQADDVVTVAQCGTEVVASDPGAWYLSEAARDLAGYVYTDKPIYRPGHTVHIKGVLRWRAHGTLARFDQPDVEVRITDVNDKVVFRERRPVDGYGAIDATFPVPAGGALGTYTILVQSGDDQAGGSFEVQEYRKPEFEVIVTPADRFLVQGGQAAVTITARYYFGQPVAGATAAYVVHEQPYYSPFRWSDDAEETGGGWWGGEERPGGTVRLDDQGSARITVPTAVNEQRDDYSMRIEARVTDASGREVAGYTIVHVTYAKVLLTADLDRYIFQPGSAAGLRVRAVDYAGSPQAGLTVNVWLEKLVYARRWDEPQATRISEGVIETGPDGRGTWSVTLPREPGDYRLRASTRWSDRDVQCEVHAWIPGRPDVEQEEQYLELVADRNSYAPGDVARFTIKGGQADVPVLVTKETQEVSYRQVTRPGAGGVFEVPVTEGDIGDTWVNVVYLKDDRLFRAEKRVKVPATTRQLQIAVTADQALARPRQPATFTVKVTDAAGRPVQAQLSLGVIDEAVYGVKADGTPDPLRFFYRHEYSRVGTMFSRTYSFVGYSGTEQLLLARRRRPLVLADFKADRPSQPQVRKDFPDAIFWAPSVVTGADGVARVEVTYPDSLTTWRLTARAVTADTLVGSAVLRTTTTKDLIVRVITPRFLTEGDEVTIPEIVHNYLPGTRPVTVAITTDGLAPAGTGGTLQPRSVPVAEHGEARIDWRFRADRVGPVTLAGSATTDADADALELSLPVLPFGLKRQAGAAGSWVGPGERSAELAIPDTANPAGRSIRVSLAPSLAGALLGALDFLTSYPYGCTEQTLSSFVPNVVVLKALDQLKIAPTERLRALDRQVSEGLTRLADYQHDDGGWGWWKTDANHPFMTAYALYGLLEARAAGYQVDAGRLRRAVRTLTELYAKYPRAVPDLKAYEAYVLALAYAAREDDRPLVDPDEGYVQAQALSGLWEGRARMSPYGQAFLLLALEAAGDGRADDLARELATRVRTKGELAWWPAETDPLLEDVGDTSVEATALIVKGIVARDPTNPVLEPAVRWLLLNRDFGTYWSSTKQTAMVLYGLIDYMRARGELTADTSVDVFVNGEAAGSRTFTAADLTSPDPVVFTAPGRSGPNAVRLVKRGGGALYWSATAEYFDRAGPLERTGTRQLAIVRAYYSLTPVTAGDGRVVYRQTPLRASVSPGDVLLVRLSVAGSKDWRYLMLEDPLPAGAEPIQQSNLYEVEGERRVGWYQWSGERREFRDDRVVFFQRDFSRGRYDFTYLLKVVTPGSFRAMPAQVSPMYIPGATAWTDAQALAVAAPAGGDASGSGVRR